MKRYYYVILWVLFLGNTTSFAFATEYVSVAPFTGQNVDKNAPSPELMHELVLSCLSANNGIAVVERADLNPVMTEQSLKMTGISKTPHGQNMQFKGIHYLITGSVTDIDGRCLLSLQANDVASTQIISSHSAAVSSNHLAAETCDNAVAPLIEKLLHKPAHGAANTPIETNDNSRDGTLLLQGIGDVNNGAYAKSFPRFLKILNHNPHNEDAKYWLTISYAKAGLAEFAQKEAEEFIAEFPSSPKSKELEPIAKPLQKETEQKP